MADLIAHLKGSVRALLNCIALNVCLVDGSGNQVTSFGGTGGTSSDFGAAFPTSGTAIGAKDSGGTNMAPLNLNGSGELKVAGSFSSTPPAAATSTLTSVAENLASDTLLVSNAARQAFMLYNDSDGIARVKFGATASASSFNHILPPRGFLSTRDVGINYTGRIDAIWDSTPGAGGGAGAAMRVTELEA